MAASFFADCANADPPSVHHIHRCGLASTFLSMVKNKEVLPSADLIIILPAVVCCLGITEDGGRRLKVSERSDRALMKTRNIYIYEPLLN